MIAREAYRRFVANGTGQPSPWSQVTGQIFLGSPAFLERMKHLLHGRTLANIPTAQTQPTRLSPEEVLQQVASVYGVATAKVLERSHRDGYQTAVYLLRRAANEPLQTAAIRFRVSPSRISKIQRALDGVRLTPEQQIAFMRCKAKH